MKKLLLCLLLILLSLSLFSCKKTKNMSELLAYENEPMLFTLSVTDGKTFPVTLELCETGDVLRFTEAPLAGISVSFSDDGKVTLAYEAYETALPSSSLLKALHWKELFHLSEQDYLWKIEKQTLGGAEVFVCKAQGITVYIDSGTFLPLKIENGDIVIDVLSSKNQSSVTPKE